MNWEAKWHGGAFDLDMKMNDVCANFLCRVKFQEQGFGEIRDPCPKVKTKKGPIFSHNPSPRALHGIMIDQGL